MSPESSDQRAGESFPVVHTSALPSSEQLVQSASKLWLGSLRANGNHPSVDHRLAGWQLLRAMVDQLYGILVGRYAYALHCGAGKTQAVVALLTAMHSLGAFRTGKTVLIVAQQVKALCEIKQKLIDGGVPEVRIGIVHTKVDALFPSTGEQKRPIMLATHARVQRDGSVQECCRRFDGSIHDLVIWDEALISTEAVALTLDTTVTALGHFANTGKCPAVALAFERLSRTFEHEQALQQSGQTPREVRPLVSELEADVAERELQAVGRLDDTGNMLRDRARRGISLIRNSVTLIDPRNGDAPALLRYVVKVPDVLTNIVILDASHAIDELRQADKTILRGTTEAMVNFKNFANVKAVHYPVCAGKSTISQDGKAIVQAVCVVGRLDKDEPVLLVTFKDGHDRKLVQELRAAGVPVDRVMPDGKPYLTVITWGKHTSDNSHTHCKHVVLVGLNRLSLMVLASSYVAQRRDLTHRRDKLGLLDLLNSVIAGHALQAMNRGCMRLTDAEGMAHAMTVHIIDKADLRPLLKRAMPGLRWETAAVKEPTRTEEAASLIVEFMTSLSEATLSISTRRLYEQCGITLGKESRAAALAEAQIRLAVLAVKNPSHRWTKSSRSLERSASA